MNAKGAILKAIERFRLKTCIDFKPWENETNYVKVFKGTGCYSYVGNLQRGEQTVSIGDWCDSVEIVQHEFVHTLGFYHEQTRSDRDDYVTIIWDNIKPGYEGIFGKGTAPSFLNVPYDYTSLMHYSMDAFGNGGPTILTKNPFFKTLIGGQMDLSEKDVQQINRLYNCTSSVTFLDSCSFELDNICGMVQNSEDNADWLYVSHVPAGPSTDRTYVGKATGYFMHYNTSTGNAGDKAMLESRLFYPKRGIQCLEFFYYNSGSENDELNIWIREYTGDSPNGTLRFINTVTGKPSDYWELHYAPIKTTNKFRFVFQGVKGTGYSNGGFSIDDINLSETECPHYVFHIRNFTHDVTKVGVVSPPYYSKDGYAYHISVWEYGDWVFGYSLHLVSGANDNSLQWPCPWRQVVVEIMDQQPNIQQRTSNVKTLTTDPNSRLSASILAGKQEEGEEETYAFSPNDTAPDEPEEGTSRRSPPPSEYSLPPKIATD
ncbi:meprin A subunit beta-like [Rhinophrynus dorsalis]